MSYLTVAQVEERARDLILALDATDYAQGGVDAAWTEANQLGATSDAPGHLAHLRFQAKISDSPSAYGEREPSGGEARLRSRLDVVFTYRLRPTEKLADSRKALDAAHDIVRALNVPRADWNTVLVNAGRPLVTADGNHMVVAVTFDILHHIEV